MKKQNYATAHASLRLSAKRFEQSPYLEKYDCDELLFGLYARRFYPLSLGQDPVEQYWQLRRGVMLYDVPEKPLEIKGPDALALLERVFTRRISDLKLWRARYAIACTPQGGIVMDGVLIRLAEDHFYYVTADGDFEQWLFAHSAGLEVKINDPRSRVLQIQGPKSLDLLRDAVGGRLPEPFGYFHAGMLDFGGQHLLTSRTGWTGELGFEIYSVGATTDHSALWDHLIDVGKSHGMQFSSAESMGIRRIEAGILDYGTDIDMQMTPYQAGLG
ncbi:MAG: glycine cleavage system aminomethyltransferase T, partial [Gammaproteobacteria bacterium]